MPATITATPDPGRARIEVRLDGFPDTPVTVHRVAGGVRRAVRAANPIRPLGGTAFFFDYEAPFGVGARYEASDGTSTITSSTVTVSTSRAWLKNPAQPALNLPVRLAEIPARERPRRRVVFEPLGRADPVVVSDVRSTARGQVTLITFTDAEADDLLNTLGGTAVALLQIPGNRFGSRYLALGNVTEAPLVAKRWVQAAGWETEWIEVAYPPGGQVGDLSGNWQTLLDEGGTWGTLRDAGGTWLGLLRGDAS